MNTKNKKEIIAILCALVVMVILVGCGNDWDNITDNNTIDSTEQLSLSSLNKKDFSPSRSMEERKTVTYTNYLSSNYEFDLAEYAEALGYTSLQSPLDKGVVMYAITRGETTWFISYIGYELTVYADCGDGCYYKTPIRSIGGSGRGRHTYHILKKGKEESRLEDDGFYSLVGIFSYISKMENLSFEYLPDYTSITRYEGAPEYYSNGLICYMNHGKFLETKYMVVVNENPYEI